MSSICVITPTISRPTLERALCSAELEPDDEWIVFGDGPQPEAQEVVRELKERLPYFRYLETKEKTGNNGNLLRELAMMTSKKDYFLFLDDDDIFLPGAIETVRKQMNDCPVLFRFNHPGAGIIWKKQIVTPGNVGGSMLCLPNDPKKRAAWSSYTGHGADVQFIKDTLALWDDYKWAGEVIIEVEPNELYNSI